MIQLLIILLVTFIIFISCLIVLTRKEEMKENHIKEGNLSVDGTLIRSERVGSSIEKDCLKYIYKATYQYNVENRIYTNKTKIIVDSNCIFPLPNAVIVYYLKQNPKESITELKEKMKGIEIKENVKSLIPSILISFLFGLFLMYIFLAKGI